MAVKTWKVVADLCFYVAVTVIWIGKRWIKCGPLASGSISTVYSAASYLSGKTWNKNNWNVANCYLIHSLTETQKLNSVILHFLNSLRSVYIAISFHFSNDKLFWNYLCLWTLRFKHDFLRNQYGPKDKRLESSVHVSVSKISPYINILLSNKQCQFCHISSFFSNSGEVWIDKCKAKDRWNADTVT